MQISPEGATQPIPAYFDRHYTNLTRTMEDFRNDMMNEIQDVKNLMYAEPQQQEPFVKEEEQFQGSTLKPANEYFIQEQEKLTSPVKSLINTFENFSINDNNEEDAYVPVEEEEPFVSKSPEQEGLFSKLTKLFSNWEQTTVRSNEREQALDELRNYASEFNINIRYRDSNGNQKMKSAQQLKADITKKIKTMI